jgi:apyrase
MHLLCRKISAPLPIMVLILFIGIFAILHAPVSLGFRFTQYAVVFDAGSTGTRVNVFKFKCPRTSSDCVVLPVDRSGKSLQFFSKIDQGLSSFAAFPEGARPGLRVLVEQAHGLVESNRISAFFGATAGLRLLADNEREVLLSVAREEVNNRFPASEVKVIDGKDEALYQWLTVSFLAKDKQTLIVDMGGGSVQLAFKSPRGPMRIEEESYLHQLNDGTFLFLHSWLGFGLKAARMKILETSESSACLNVPVKYEYAGIAADVSVKTFAVDKEKQEACFAQVASAMNIGKGCDKNLTPCAFDGGWRGPQNEQQSVFLFSFIFDICRKLRLFPDGSYDNHLTVGQIVSAAEMQCQESESAEDFLCLDSAYIANLLHKGLGLSLQAQVRVLNKILYDGHLFEGAWALGAALSSLNK